MKKLSHQSFTIGLCLLMGSTTAFAAPLEQDLLASYAATYASSVGGEDNAQVIIANTVAGNNVIQDQSGTGAHMRIAGFYQSANDVTGQTTTGGIVNWLSGNSSQLADVVTQGANVGADLVVYICNNTDSSSTAGVSQQPGMYSSLNPGAVWSAVFAHETGGHAYGRSHSDGVPNPKTIMLHNYCGGGGAAPPYFYSNPNIWFNGVQLLGDGANNCSMGSLVNGGDNSSCSAQAVTDRRDRIVTAPALNNVVLHWMFTNAPASAPAGTTNYDLVSGAPAVVRGNSAAYTGNALRIPGGTTGNVAMSSMSAYIDLPNGIISSQTNITIEIWATPLSAPSWARICDFGRCTGSGDGLGVAGEYTGATSDPAPGSTTADDDIMLSADIGTDITQQRFESRLAGYATTLDSGLATVAGVQHHYVITFTDGAGAAGSSGGRWQWFRDGDAVAFLDVTNHLSAIHDVNNWLGRSMWSGDNNANNDYSEVRISNVVLTRNQILANYLLGPNYISTANVTLTGSDAGGSSSFNAGGQWSNASAPSAGNNYETYGFRLRTPATSSSYTFGGSSLKISGGSLAWNGTASSTVTVNNLTLDNASVMNQGSGTGTLAGNVTVTNGAMLNAENGPLSVSANLSGNGPITAVANAVTLSGNNSSFTGKTSVGNGMSGTLIIDSQSRLGGNPSTFAADQLDINRGTLQATASFAINDPNRGILIDVSGATFNVASGTTLTLSSPWSSPATSSSIIEGIVTKTGAGTLVLGSPGNGFRGTLYIDTGSTTANDGAVRVTNNNALANARAISIRNNNSGSSTLQLDGTTGGVTVPQVIQLSGRTAAVSPIDNIAGTNTLGGGVTINVGGGNYWFQSDSGRLNLGGTLSSAATGSRTLTFLGNGNHAVYGQIADGSASVSVIKTGTGTLTMSGNNTYSGSTAVNQGTLKLQPSTAVVHLTFDNAAGSSNGTIITNTGSGGPAMNGVIVGSGANIVSGGRYGNALSINGVGGTAATNIVLVSNKAVTTDATGSWTVGYWIKTTTAGAVILYQGDGTWSSSGQTAYLLNANSGSTAGTHAGAVRWAGGFLTGTAAPNNGNWHFVTLVDNAGTESIYVDGALDSTTSTMSGALSSLANQMWIGGSPDSDTGAVKINGLIDEVYMFNRALGVSEIQALYNSNNPLSTTIPVLPVTTVVSVASGSTFDLGGMTQTIGALSGSGIVTNTSSGTATLIVSNSTGATFSGVIGDASLATAINFVQVGATTNTLSGANTYRGTTTVGGGMLIVNGSTGTGATTVSNATLTGNGTISGSMTIQAGGLLSPGTGIGKMTANGSVTLQSGATNWMEISKTALTNDQLSAGSTVTYGGTLVVTNLGGTLIVGDSFKLFNAPAYAGAFANVILPPLTSGLSWNNTLTTDGTLHVVASAKPAIASATIVSGNSFTMNATGGPAGNPFRVLTSTNITVPFANWIPIWTNSFDSNGNGAFTNAFTPTSPQQFYNISVP